MNKVAQVPLEVKKSDVFAWEKWTFAIRIALFLQTCDKHCCRTFGGEMKSCFSLGTNDVSLMNSQCGFAVKRMFPFHLPKCGSNFCHTSAWILQIHSWNVICLQRNAWFHFRSQGETWTFVTCLPEQCHPDCICSLVCSKTLTYLWTKQGVNYFCYTSGVKTMHQIDGIHGFVEIWVICWNPKEFCIIWDNGRDT